ncbi:MAG: DNA polymerase III subunit epsilon [Rhodospirillaceae bacterium]|nr:DNA polymerase III subunit epsilon [Rhodospirillaceae bacterium]
MREIVLDTETTGFDPLSGHRVVEIGCIELLNHMPTGREFHRYLNPERDMPAEAEAVHGLSAAFLADKPLFSSLADDLLGFIGDSPIIAHNAGFDMNFINAELRRIGRGPLAADRAIDTVILARRKFPGAQASLDALCRRFQIDLSERGKHGALLDAKLLARVYLELIGGREPGLALAASEVVIAAPEEKIVRTAREPRAHEASADELAAHAAFVAKLKNPIWLKAAAETPA